MSGIARILLFRHALHGVDGRPKNILPPSERHRMIGVGSQLQHHGLAPAFALSSPEGRSLETALCLLQGIGTMVPVRTDDRLGEAREPIANKPPETGEQAAGLLFALVLANPGKTFLVVSHVSRIELVLGWFLRIDARTSIRPIERGSGIVLTFDLAERGSKPQLERLDDRLK